MTIEATGVLTVATFEATAVDNEDPDSVVITYSHEPGSEFPLGDTTVTATAVDGALNPAECSFTITVIDTTPPVPTCPADLTIEATGVLTVATFEATAVDNEDPDSVVITYRTIEATGVLTVATFEATAVDNEDPDSVVITYSHEPGSEFPLGDTTVTATAVDGALNPEECSFIITVEDTTPPTDVDATGPDQSSVVEGKTVTLQGSANDLCDSQLDYLWTDENGQELSRDTSFSKNNFAVGIHTITLTVEDDSNNIATDSVTITIRKRNTNNYYSSLYSPDMYMYYNYNSWPVTTPTTTWYTTWYNNYYTNPSISSLSIYPFNAPSLFNNDYMNFSQSRFTGFQGFQPWQYQLQNSSPYAYLGVFLTGTGYTFP